MMMLLSSFLICSATFYTFSSTEDDDKMAPVKLFHNLFRAKRREQNDAVKSILNYGDYTKQYKIIDTIVSKGLQILKESQVILRESGYIPGMDFPTEDNVRDALSLTLENTAFLGEILLHLPDITHKVLNSNKEEKLYFIWGIFFASQSRFLDKKSYELIRLVSQELGIAQEEGDYVNPYSKANSNKGIKKTSPPKRKKKRSFKKGPMLSRNSEL